MGVRSNEAVIVDFSLLSGTKLLKHKRDANSRVFSSFFCLSNRQPSQLHHYCTGLEKSTIDQDQSKFFFFFEIIYFKFLT